MIENTPALLEKVDFVIADGLSRLSLQGISNGFDGMARRLDWVETVYDGNERVSQLSNPLTAASGEGIPSLTFPAYTTTRYDGLSRVVEVETPDGQIATTEYQANRTVATDQAGLSRGSRTDGLGRLTSAQEPDPDSGVLANGYETRYLYDARGNLLEVLQGEQVRAFEYDSLGRLTRQTHPESGTTWHFYDDNSNPTFRMDERGKIREQLYDQLDRLTATHFYDITFRLDDTPWLDFFYDTGVNGVGRLASVDETRPSGEQTGESDYQYDVMGRVTRMDRGTLSHVFVSLYEYNFLGGITSATYPQAGNSVLEWTYDDQGRQTSVSLDSLTLADSYSFVHNGLTALETTDFPQSNRQEKITYNGRLQPVLRQVIDQGTGMEQMRLDYSFKRPGDQANNGNVWQIVDALDPDKSVSYDYDFLNRITEAKHDQALHQGGPSWSIGYGYDRYGNRLSALTTLGAPPSFQDASTPADPQSNRLVGRKYDAAGNLVQDGSRTFQWDAENRLASVDSGATAEYLYDYQGRRVAKITAPETRFYDWDMAGEVFWETSLGASQPDTVRAYLNGRLISESKDGVGSHSIFSDHLGSPHLKIDLTAGTSFSSDFFYPFGQRLGPSNPADDHARAFTGKERDSESELDYFGARYYDGTSGRFMSSDSGDQPDPIPYSEIRIPQTLNGYAYTINNPLKYKDPNGHCVEVLSCTFEFGAVGSVGGPGGTVGGAIVGAIVGTGIVVAGYFGYQYLTEDNAGTDAGVQPKQGSDESEGEADTSEAVLGPDGRIEGVYEFPDASMPGRTYVGQSSNIGRRMKDHERVGKKDPGTEPVTKEVPGGKTAREIAEQNRVDELGGTREKPDSQTSNQRNPIGPKRQHLLKKENQ